MGQAYPELGRAQALITETLKLEEERFRTTLDRGLKLLDDELAKLPEGAALPGEAAFKLYDTYGFPLDLTQDALREKSREVDIDGFDAAMAEQKAKARAAWSGSGEAGGCRDLVRPGRGTRLDRVPGLRHRDRRGRGPGAGQGRGARRHGEGETPCRSS
jgi:alanyl-tRNA synthetase